ncbi:MAG: oligoendopeptidase F [Candidatus Zixiibacteriota bacterium]
MKRQQNGLAMSIIAALLLCATIAQAGPNTSNRDSIPDKYKWDLGQIYTDWAAWEQGLARLQQLMDEYAALKGTLASGPQAILKASQVGDELGMLAYKVYRYAGLHNAQDMRDNEVSGRLQQVQLAFVRFGIATAWYNPELLSIPWETMQQWLDSTPELKPYRYGISDLYRQQTHVLTEDKEQLLAYYSQVNAAPSEIYGELTTSDIKYPETILSDGNTVKLTPGAYYSILSSNRNQADRAKAFETFYGVYHDYRNTYAAIYNGILQRDWATAQARNYSSCLESYLDADNVPVEVYKTLVNTVRAGTGPLRRYYKLVRERLGLAEYHLYDGMIPLVEFDKRYDYDQIQPVIIQAMAPLGKDYQTRLKTAFESRWIDVYENEGKRTGAFSASTYGVHPFLLLNYNETLTDFYTVAHELGHCMHSMLSHETQPFSTSEPTIFVAEVASTMNEALLLDYQLARTKDPVERIALLTRAINSIDGTFYTQTMWADYEMRMHEAVEKGMPITAESIRDLYSGLQEEYYGDAVTVDEFYRFVWTRISHFYNSPFYVYKYATCYATSAKLTAEITSKDKKVKQAGLDRYMTLLKSGSNDYPMELLRKAGVDLSKPETFQAIVDKLDQYVTLLEKELAKL